MPATKNTKTKTILRPLIVLGIIIGIATLAGIGIMAWNRHQANTATQTNGTVNYSPPTEEEQKAGDEQKDRNVKRDESLAEQPSISTADIVIVDAGQYDDEVEVRSYIGNVYEDGGTCKAVFTKDGQTIEQSNTAFKDATTTQCGTITLARSRFSSPGDWNLVIQYNSSKYSGESKVTTLTVR